MGCHDIVIEVLVEEGIYIEQVEKVHALRLHVASAW